MQRLGMACLVLGAGVLVGYAAYALVKALFTEEIPLPVSIGLIVAVVGFVLRVAGVGYDRWRASRKEDFDEEVGP